MSLADWKTLAEAVKAAVEAIAVIGGGIWALFTFGALRQIAKAQADIANTEATRRKTEAEIAKLTEQARVGAVVSMKVETTPLTMPHDPAKYLSVSAEVSNCGSRHAQLDYPDDPLKVYAVAIKPDGFEYTRVTSAHVVNGLNPNNRSQRLLVRVGGTEHLNFIVRLDRAGLYFLALHFPISDEEQKIAKQFGFKAKGHYSAKRYVLVS